MEAGAEVAGELVLDPLDPLPDDPAVLDASEPLELELLLSLDDFASVEVDVLLASSFFPGFVDEYRSAYQPPPFKMKRPPLICRRAVD